MKTASDFTPEEKAQSWMLQQKRNDKIFKLGQKEMLKNILQIIHQWEKGLYSDEEFKKALRNYYQEFYGKNNRTNVSR